MQIYTRVEFQWDGSKYVQKMDEGFEYTGPVAEMKGASSAETNLANSQSQFATTLQNDYGTQFANQSAILGSLNSSLAPIVNAGVGQYGFSGAEDAAMRTQATAGTAAQYQNAKQAAGAGMAAAGGGNQQLPSGAQTEVNSQIAQGAAQQESSQQLGITQAGYAQGRQNYMNAVGAEGNVASQYNPTGYAGQADSATNSAFNQASTVNQQNIAGSPWSIAGGVLGGVAGAAASGLTGGLSNGISNSITGASNTAAANASSNLGYAQGAAAMGGPVATLPSDESTEGMIGG
jgi:hypothetical protein